MLFFKLALSSLALSGLATARPSHYNLQNFIDEVGDMPPETTVRPRDDPFPKLEMMRPVDNDSPKPDMVRELTTKPHKVNQDGDDRQPEPTKKPEMKQIYTEISYAEGVNLEPTTKPETKQDGDEDDNTQALEMKQGTMGLAKRRNKNSWLMPGVKSDSEESSESSSSEEDNDKSNGGEIRPEQCDCKDGQCTCKNTTTPKPKF